jgi:hypothetical protein
MNHQKSIIVRILSYIFLLFITGACGNSTKSTSTVLPSPIQPTATGVTATISPEASATLIPPVTLVPSSTPIPVVKVSPTAPESTSTLPPPMPAIMPALPEPIPAEKIGADLGGINDRGLEFIDLGKTLRRWEHIDNANCSETDDLCRYAPLDENGWPESDAKTVVFDLRPFGAWWGIDQTQCPLCQDGNFQIDVSGTYKLTFIGQATIGNAEGSTQIANQQYDEATNTTSAEAIIGKGQGLMFLTFTDTKRLPDDPSGTGIMDLHIFRPGYDPETRDIFTQPILQAVEPFGVIRFMNWVGGNNINPAYEFEDNTLEWAERNTTDKYQYEGEGVAWEYVIEFANLTQKDIWINIPIHASDDYVQGLAQLLKDTLHPDARIYIEYSNEVWNSLFSQYQYNVAAAAAEVAAGNSILNADENEDTGQWARRRYVKRLVEFSGIFREVFGEEAINNKIRIVHSWQAVQPWQFREQLEWVYKTYGDPGKYFYGIACATYFNIEGIDKKASVDAILKLLWDNSDRALAEYRTQLADVAESYGLKLMAYEGGPDTAGPLQWERPTDLQNNVDTAQRDPRIKDVIVHDLRDNWFNNPTVNGDVFIYFTLQSAFSRWGQWGLTEDINNIHTAKFDAIYDLRGVQADVPPVPTGLSADPESPQPALSWTAVSQASLYAIQRAYMSGGPYVKIAFTQLPRFVDSGLPADIPYYYVISTINRAGESEVSEELVVSAMAVAPGRVRYVNATGGKSQVVLSWQPAQGAESYKIMYATDIMGPYKDIGTTTKTTFTHTGLANGTKYFYVIIAVNAYGESPESFKVFAVPVDISANALPLLKAADAPVIDGIADPVWDNASLQPIEQFAVRSAPDIEYPRAYWQGLWDENNLYLFIVVTDTYKVNNADAGAPWEGDCIEVFIDGNNSKGTAYDGQNDLQYIFRYNGKSPFQVSLNRTEGVKFAQLDTSIGYIMEIKLPWKTLGVSPVVGNLIGIEIQVGNDNNGEGRQNKIGWWSPGDNAWADPSTFGTLLFVEK